MRALLLVTLLACGSSEDDVNHGPPSPAKRRAMLKHMNDKVGGSGFALGGLNDDELIVTSSDCNLVFLNQLIQTSGMQELLKLGEFKSVRCEGGMRVTAPW